MVHLQNTNCSLSLSLYPYMCCCSLLFLLRTLHWVQSSKIDMCVLQPDQKVINFFVVVSGYWKRNEGKKLANERLSRYMGMATRNTLFRNTQNKCQKVCTIKCSTNTYTLYLKQTDGLSDKIVTIIETLKYRTAQMGDKFSDSTLRFCFCLLSFCSAFVVSHFGGVFSNFFLLYFNYAFVQTSMQWPSMNQNQLLSANPVSDWAMCVCAGVCICKCFWCPWLIYDMWIDLLISMGENTPNWFVRTRWADGRDVIGLFAIFA